MENSSLFDHKLQNPPGTNESNIASCYSLGPMANGSPWLDADGKSSICAPAAFDLTRRLSDCKGRAVYVCTHVHMHIWISWLSYSFL